MKLEELATQLTLEQAEVISFLATTKTPLVVGPNTDLEDARIAEVRHHFTSLRNGSTLNKEVSADKKLEGSNDIFYTNIGVIPEISIANDVGEPIKTNKNTLSMSENDAPEQEPLTQKKVVKIKVSKVELPGLKVVGKIELTRPKLKGKETDDVSAKEGKMEADITKQSSTGEKQPHYKPRKSRTVLQQGLRQEKQKQAELKKEKRTQRYYEKISQYNPPVKPLRKTSESDYEVYEEIEESPKSWLSKFFHWFTSS